MARRRARFLFLSSCPRLVRGTLTAMVALFVARAGRGAMKGTFSA
jgi:hypothetical protein